MAEIRIRRRRTHGAWAWLIVLVLPFAYLVYWSTARQRALVERASADAGSIVIPRDTVAPPDPVALYASFVARRDTATSEQGARAWAGAGLGRLADAIATLSGASAPSNQRALERIRSTAAALADTRANARTVTGDQLRGAATAAADVIQIVQRAAYPAAAEVVTHVRAAAGGIRTTAPVAAQRDNLLRFFMAARDALQAMGPTAGVARDPRAP